MQSFNTHPVTDAAASADMEVITFPPGKMPEIKNFSDTDGKVNPLKLLLAITPAVFEESNPTPVPPVLIKLLPDIFAHWLVNCCTENLT